MTTRPPTPITTAPAPVPPDRLTQARYRLAVAHRGRSIPAKSAAVVAVLTAGGRSPN